MPGLETTPLFSRYPSEHRRRWLGARTEVFVSSVALNRTGRVQLRDCLAGMVGERFGSGPILLTNVATLGRGVAPKVGI